MKNEKKSNVYLTNTPSNVWNPNKSKTVGNMEEDVNLADDHMDSAEDVEDADGPAYAFWATEARIPQNLHKNASVERLIKLREELL